MYWLYEADIGSNSFGYVRLEIRSFWFCHRRLWSFQLGFMWSGWCQTNEGRVISRPRWNSTILQPPKPRPFKHLSEHSLQVSPTFILHSPSPSRSPATRGLSLLLAWVKTLDSLRPIDVLLPPSFRCQVHYPWVSVLYPHRTPVLCLH